MPKFAVAFYMSQDPQPMRHRIVEAPDPDQALRLFFRETAADRYSGDEQGFHYFKEDFFDPSGPCGSVLEIA